MNLLPRNEHNVERIIRVLVGAGVLSLAFIGPATPWGWLGLIPIATGLIGSCPLYTLNPRSDASRRPGGDYR